MVAVVHVKVPLPVVLNIWPYVPCALGYVTAPKVNVPEVFTLVMAVVVRPSTFEPSAPNWMVFAAVATAP